MNKKAEQAPIYLKQYLLIKELYGMVRHWPKQYKYTLGESLLEIAWQCLDLVLEVNHLSNEHKFAGLQKLSLSFDRLKLRIRMAQELEIISVRQFTHLQTVYLKEGTRVPSLLISSPITSSYHVVCCT